jgi:hypothetical protein
MCFNVPKLVVKNCFHETLTVKMLRATSIDNEHRIAKDEIKLLYLIIIVI